MTDYRLLPCPKCDVRLKVRSGAAGVRCPKCDTPIAINTEAARVETPPALPRGTPVIVTSLTNRTPPLPLSFSAYLRRLHQATRGSTFLWLALALFAESLASLSKPAIGTRGIAVCAASLLVLSVIAYALFAVSQWWTFFIGKQRRLPRQPRSRLAKLGYGSLIVAIGMICLTIAESFSPPIGLVASTFPTLRQAQKTTLQSLPDTSRQQPAPDAEEHASGLPVERQPFKNYETSGNDGFISTVVEKTPPTRTAKAKSDQPQASQPKYSQPQDSQDQRESAVQESQPAPIQSEYANQPAMSLEQRFGFRGNDDSLPAPGGAFAEKLMVPVGVKLYGGDVVAPAPGGAFQAKLTR